MGPWKDERMVEVRHGRASHLRSCSDCVFNFVAWVFVYSSGAISSPSCCSSSPQGQHPTVVHPPVVKEGWHFRTKLNWAWVWPCLLWSMDLSKLMNSSVTHYKLRTIPHPLEGCEWVKWDKIYEASVWHLALTRHSRNGSVYCCYHWVNS
jgi:hypothetical protein